MWAHPFAHILNPPCFHVLIHKREHGNSNGFQTSLWNIPSWGNNYPSPLPSRLPYLSLCDTWLIHKDINHFWWLLIFLWLWKYWQSSEVGWERMYYIIHTYYHGLKVRVGRTYCVPIYFMCGFKIRVAHNNFELSYVILRIFASSWSSVPRSVHGLKYRSK